MYYGNNQQLTKISSLHLENNLNIVFGVHGMKGCSTFKTRGTVSTEILETLQQMRGVISEIENKELRKYLGLWEGDRGVITAIQQWVATDKEMKQDIGLENDLISLSPSLEVQGFDMAREDNLIHSITKSGRNSDSSKPNNSQPISKIEKIKEEDDLSQEMKMLKQTKQQGSCHFYSRGPYRNYPRQEKQRVVTLYMKNPGLVSKISSQSNIPIKNIVRWAKDGIERKQGAGRKKIDPQLEERLSKKLFETFSSGSDLPISIIQKWALQICTVKEFKASKGWIKNFIQRKELDLKYHII